MTHRPKKPPEGGDEQRKGVELTRRALFSLLGRGSSAGKETEPGVEPPEEKVARGTRGKLSRRAVVAGGAALAGAIALGGTMAATHPAHAEGGGGWPGAFVVDRDRIPEKFSPEELNKLADAYSLLSQYRINPSFWRYVTNRKMEGPVYQALDAALLYPELLHYKEEGDGVVRIIPPSEPNEFSSIPIGFEIEIKGGLKNGRITHIRINNFDLAINPGASLDWKEYEEVFRQSSQEYIDTLHYMYALDRLVLDPATPIPQVRHWSSARKLKAVSWTERKLPRKFRAPINKILSEAEIEMGIQGAVNQNMPDARKVEGCRRATEKYSFLQQLLGRILRNRSTNDAQKVGQIRAALEARLQERIQAIRDIIHGFDISRTEGAPPAERLGYTSFNDYAEEVTGISARIKELLELHRRMNPANPYLDPSTENPVSYPSMQTFMERTNLFAYPEKQPDGTVVIKIFSMGLVADNPGMPVNEGINLEFQKFIAFDTTGRVMEPTDIITAAAGTTPATYGWKKFAYPGAEHKTTRQLVYDRFKAQLEIP